MSHKRWKYEAAQTYRFIYLIFFFLKRIKKNFSIINSSRQRRKNAKIERWPQNAKLISSKSILQGQPYCFRVSLKLVELEELEPYDQRRSLRRIRLFIIYPASRINCAPTMNGRWSMSKYPHEIKWNEKTWWKKKNRYKTRDIYLEEIRKDASSIEIE